jgi:hypothetical protein
MPEEVYDGATEHREHRVGAWLVLLVGIVGFVLGIYHLKSRIVGAFTINTTYRTPDQLEAERIEGLKLKDTDNDSITDFDETYVFKTSPYLEDSDSDGRSDKDELVAGDNPNCPSGKECGPLGAGAIAVQEPPPADEAAVPELGIQDEQEALDRLTNLKPEEVRQILRQSGITEEQLQKIDDATLMQLYQESLKEAQAKQPLEDATSP